MRTLEELINHDDPAIPLVRQWLAESSRQLLVLRKTTVPAVLLEVGVIVDAEDEKYVADNAKQDAIVQAIVAAADKFQH
jgi:N-acetylmuramoyl-L-alanine amidase